MPLKRKRVVRRKRKTPFRPRGRSALRRTVRRKVAHGMQKVVVCRGLAPFPQRYFCTMRTPFRFFVSAVAGPSNWYALVWANGCYIPFTSAGNDLLTNSGGTACTNYAISEAPEGSGRLLNAYLYQYYRVYYSKLTITASTALIADSFELAITPLPINTAATNVMRYAEIMPFSKKRQITSNVSGKQQILSNGVKPRDVLGYNKQQYMCDYATRAAYNGNPTNAVQWMVNFSSNINSANSSAIFFDVVLTQHVELFNMDTVNMLTA